MRALPSAPQIEEALISSFFFDANEAGGICNERGVTREHFIAPARALMFETLMELWNGQKEIDIATLTELLESRGQLQDVGGTVYLGEILGQQTSGAANQYIDTLDEKLKRRQRIRTCFAQAEKNYDETEDGAALQAELEQDVLAIGEKKGGSEVSFDQHLLGSMTRIEERRARGGGLHGLSTGLKALDDITGGFGTKELIVVSAETSGGKTALALRFLEETSVRNGFASAVFSYEMSNEELTDRMLASNSRVDLSQFRRGELMEGGFRQVQSSILRMRGAKIFLRDESDLNVMQVRAIGRRLKRLHDIRLVVVDYAQLIPPLGKKGQNREQEVAEISRNLKAMAKELDLPVVALSQLNDDGKVRESRAIGHDANVLIVIQEEGEGDQIRHFLKIAKNRNGARDRVPVTFVKPYTRFEDSVDYRAPIKQHYYADGQ